MPQSAYKTTPTVIAGRLYTDSEFTGAVVGSPLWAAFLATGATFYVEQGGFTVRCEKRRRGAFWYVYKRVAGKLVKRYVGKSENMTLACLSGKWGRARLLGDTQMQS